MAQRITTLLIDDLDGESKATETLAFGLDCSQYEIDLTDEHAQHLRDSASPFVAAARTVGRGPARRTRRDAAPTATAPKQNNNAAEVTAPDLAAVRAWARDNDLKVSDRGRVSATVLQAYQDAH